MKKIYYVFSYYLDPSLLDSIIFDRRQQDIQQILISFFHLQFIAVQCTRERPIKRRKVFSLLILKIKNRNP